MIFAGILLVVLTVMIGVVCVSVILSFYSKKTPTSKVGDELRLLPT